MSLERYAIFNERIKSSFDLSGILFRRATEKDSIGIAKLTHARDGEKNNKSLEYFIERTNSELKDIVVATDFHMLVAEVNGEIVGFGRSILYDLNKIIVPHKAPSGWYLMGVIVNEEFRRRGIGQVLTQIRIEEISKISNEVFYIVNAENKSSIKLHEKIGFEIIDEGAGFLKVTFSGGKGYLCRKILNHL